MFTFDRSTVLLLGALILLAILAATFIQITTAAPDPAVVGKWSKVKSWPVKSVHTSLLPDGKVIMWPSNAGDNPYIWNPKNDEIRRTDKAGYNLFCAGLSTMGDGKLFVAGGHIVTPKGLKAASIFDPVTKDWTRIPDMNAGRWYPTVTQLANGDMLVTSGNTETGVVNPIPQVYDIQSNSWRTLTGANLAVSLYPWMYDLGGGRVFMAGSRGASRFLDISGKGSWSSPIEMKSGSRGSGTSVMYEYGKVLNIGGRTASGAPSTNTAETINLNSASPSWKYAASMKEPRQHANATLLPNGTVLVTGGSKGLKQGEFDDETSPVFLTEWWNPNSNTWKSLAPSNGVYRGYHSIALLLPDGRILVAGGEKTANSYEIYSPPYLFQGTRPEITSAPDKVGYGKSFDVKTTQKNKIAYFRMIRLGSVTHSFNQGQRYEELRFKKVKDKKGTITKFKVDIPSDRGHMPPGYYMLFAVNNKNVPSEAKIIKVGGVEVTLPTTAKMQSEALEPIPAYNSKEDPIHDHAAHGNFE
ncbi:DUF1929 domain-containing protein [Candidatus Parcubacteria bacterium]|nr:MAG: DUF1929 domain-containing protein [Candidatus Parcubacteria bacterium]